MVSPGALRLIECFHFLAGRRYRLPERTATQKVSGGQQATSTRDVISKQPSCEWPLQSQRHPCVAVVGPCVHIAPILLHLVAVVVP